MSGLQAAYAMLAHLLKAYSPLAVAFSGGLDSRFLAFAAKRLESEGVAVQLYYFQGPHLSRRELGEAVNWAKQNDLPLRVLNLDPLEHPAVRGNEKDRCYHCKHLLFQALLQEAAQRPPFPGQAPTLCDGSNASDSAQYRPGQKALKELSIHSPLAEAGLSKADIRVLGARLGLDNPEQPARPCLLTRYAYGLPAHKNVLESLARAEDALSDLFAQAAASGARQAPPDFRLRVLSAPAGGELGRLSDYTLELHVSGPEPEEPLRAALQEAVAERGFARPVIKVFDSVSGYHDRNGETKE